MRQGKGRYSLAACLLLGGLGIFLVLSNHEQVRREEEVLETPPTSVVASLERSVDSTSTRERTNIFFLKTHKCASSTIQNILMRFGLERDLTFVLPSPMNYIGNPEMFTESMINDIYATEDGKYNIFAHHTRYNSAEVHSVMYDDAVYVSILRHPADVYESIFSFYEFQKQFNVTFEELLKSPKNIKKITKRYYNRIGFNQMSWDFGLTEEDFNSVTKVERLIKKIEEEFDLIMITEWMEASLVLLADLMKWPLENVMFLKLNSRSADSIYVMSDFERKRVVELNNVDFKLYSHFLVKFRNRVIDYGEARFKKDIEKLLFLNNNLQCRCVQSLDTKGFAHTQGYKLRDEGDKLCYFAAKNELAFTQHLKEVQKHKIRVLKRLDILLHDYTDVLEWLSS